MLNAEFVLCFWKEGKKADDGGALLPTFAPSPPSSSLQRARFGGVLTVKAPVGLPPPALFISVSVCFLSGGRRGSGGGGHSRQLYLVPEARHRDHLFPVSLNLSPVSSLGGLCVLHTWLSCNRSSQTVQVWSDWIRTLFTVYRWNFVLFTNSLLLTCFLSLPAPPSSHTICSKRRVHMRSLLLWILNSLVPGKVLDGLCTPSCLKDVPVSSWLQPLSPSQEMHPSF